MAEPHFFGSAADYRAWLQAHADKASELLVGYYKRGTGRASLSWSESVDDALCFGWIDGVRKRIDEHSYCIRFTPRKPRSIWSAINIAKVEHLRAEGKMAPAGELAFSKRTEARSAVYSHEQEEVAQLSADELQAFQQQVSAWHFFQATPPGYQKTVLHWITTAKRPDTRVSRLAKLVEACAAGLRLR